MSKYSGKFDLLDELSLMGLVNDNGDLLDDPKDIAKKVKVFVGDDQLHIVTGHELAPFYTHVPMGISSNRGVSTVRVSVDNFFDEECRRVVNRAIKADLRSIRRYMYKYGKLPTFRTVHSGFDKGSIWHKVFKAACDKVRKKIEPNIEEFLPLWCQYYREQAAYMMTAHGYPAPLSKKWYKVNTQGI